MVTLAVPADVQYFRTVRLAVGGVATMAGFDIEAIEDLRIGVDELCSALLEGGNGDELRFEFRPKPGSHVRIDGVTAVGDLAVDPDRSHFSHQILSVVADDFAVATIGREVRCWLERRLVADGDAPAAGLRRP